MKQLELIITKEEHDKVIQEDSRKWSVETVTQELITETLSDLESDMQMKDCLSQVRKGERGKQQYSVPLMTYCLRSQQYCPLQDSVFNGVLTQCNHGQLSPTVLERYDSCRPEYKK